MSLSPNEWGPGKGTVSDSFETSRFKTNYSDSKGNSNRVGIYSKENRGKDLDFIEPKPELQPEKHKEEEPKQDSIDFNDGFTEKKTPEFSFTFKFPTYEEFSQSRGEIGDPIRFETEVVSFNPKELTNDSNVGSFGDRDGANDGKFSQINCEAKSFCEEIPEESTDGEAKAIGEELPVESTDGEAKAIGEELPVESTSDFFSDDVLEKIEAMRYTKEEEKPVDTGKILASDDVQVHSEKDSSGMDSDSESFSSSPLRSVMKRLMDSYSNDFLSDGDFGGEMSDFDETGIDDSNKDPKGVEFDEDDKVSMEEQEGDFQDEGNLNSDFLSEKDFPGKMDESTDKFDPGKVSSKETQDWDSEDSNKMETLWEHQDLIEQLKNELKKVKATGLPTILEESEESPRMMEDLKPWKIDEKFQRTDRLDDLHKLYRSYRERMRKFDILNFQKMYAIGFLQLKDPLKSISTSQKSAVQSVIPEKNILSKRKKTGSDPTMKFMEELQSELEVVYVGQMCLSWEILHWQHGKAVELWESDHRGIRLYNEVAGEYQQFQVLMQRFVEDEPFQGPRVQYYVKSRCVLRNLLQVPVIREDPRDRKKAMKRGDYAITSDDLVEIIEESIRIFWRFVRADKDCSSTNAKCRKGPPHVDLQNPEDSELLMEVRANLQKKEKKLRELLRRGSCILKRFQKRGKLVYQSTKKRASGPKCPVTGKRIQGIPHLRPAEYKRSRLSRNRRTVNRAYGGVLSAGAVRERIIRAFLVEEQKIVKKVLKIQKAKEKQTSKS
ncbi:hypothetical protein RHSIM_Rhsim10G0039600 [Rhododendron simsii]|uniref:60S ribosomal protein L34 n=1 Tax=Rhododendron simsii TaxID=118357 RepID=A0A834LBW3_RHOSS|nr:hypothetical protein RHSIM_Rhsim10G0039600 [Rhododendron simsii]